MENFNKEKSFNKNIIFKKNKAEFISLVDYTFNLLIIFFFRYKFNKIYNSYLFDNFINNLTKNLIKINWFG